MGRILTQLINRGAESFVRGLAAEAAGITKASATRKGGSPLSRAIRYLRREFDLPSGPESYEAARNIFRRAVRTASRTKREQDRQFDRIARGLDPVPARRANAPPVGESEYTVTVKLESNRSNRVFWTTVHVTGRSGMAYSKVARMARDAAAQEGAYTTGSGRRRVDVGVSFQVTEYYVLAEIALE